VGDEKNGNTAGAPKKNVQIVTGLANAVWYEEVLSYAHEKKETWEVLIYAKWA